jgi:hypothetical protein
VDSRNFNGGSSVLQLSPSVIGLIFVAYGALAFHYARTPDKNGMARLLHRLARMANVPWAPETWLAIQGVVFIVVGVALVAFASRL